MDDLIQRSRGVILQLAEQRGIRRVRLFGSMVRDEAREDSDVDLLVELGPGCSGLALGGFLMDVSELLGRKVDVVTEKALHPRIRGSVLREAQPL
jgi:predicted nucleotidyltransferase